MATLAALWQVQADAADGTEARAGQDNTILFNNTPVLAAGGYIYRTDFTLRTSTPENTSIDGGSNDIEDMGTDGVDIQLAGELKNVDSEIDKLVDFFLEDKTVSGYTKGRFGLRLDFPTRFNVTPTENFGYVIDTPQIHVEHELKKISSFVLRLRLGGDVKLALTKMRANP